MQAIKKRLLTLPNSREAFELTKIFESLFNTQCLTSATLTGGAAATVTLGNAITAFINGVAITKATGSAFTLNGPTIQNTGSVCQVWVFLMDATGTLSVLPGVPATTLAGVQWPVIPEITMGAGTGGIALGLQPVVIGSMTMNNASVGAFIPNTTLLNVANLGIVFNNTVGPFFPIQTL